MTTTRVAIAAALTLFTALGLSACGGDELHTVYLSDSDKNANVISIHGDKIAIANYKGETCEDFTTFFDSAESGDFNAIDNEDGDDDNDIGAIIPAVGTLNDDRTQILWPSDIGEDPTTFATDVPNTGYITIGSEGEYYLPLDSDEGKKLHDSWKTAQCS